MKKKSIIFSSIVLGLAVLSFILFFMPIIEGVASLFDHIEYLSYMSAGGEGILYGVIIGLFQLLAFIEIIAIIGFGVVALLNACGVIKNEKLANIFRTVNIVLAALVAVAMLAFLLFFVIKFSMFEVGVLFMMIFAIAMAVLSVFDKKAQKAE